jgi:hypothetical protein
MLGLQLGLLVPEPRERCRIRAGKASGDPGLSHSHSFLFFSIPACWN